MTIWRRAAERAVRWNAGLLAGRALTAAAYGDWSRGHELTARAIRHGPAAIERIVTVWCAAILSGLPPGVSGCAFAGPVPAAPGAGGPADLDRAPPARWAERVLAAAVHRDRALLLALIDAVPAEERERHLAGLLDLVVDAVMAHDDGSWP